MDTKRLTGLIAFCSLLFTSATALAQHTLLPGDVVAPGQFSFEARYDYSRFSSDMNTVGGNSGEYKQMTGVGSMQLAAGLGGGVGLSVALPYAFFENTSIESTPAFNRHREGLSDLSIGGKLQFVNTEAVNLTAGLVVKLNSAGEHAGSGTTEYTPSLALTFNRKSSFSPFIVYAPTVVTTNRAPDSQTIEAGANLKSPFAEFIVIGQFRFNNEWEYSDNREWKVSVEPVIALNKSVSLTPSIAYIHRTSADSRTGGYGKAAEAGYTAGMGLYFQF